MAETKASEDVESGVKIDNVDVAGEADIQLTGLGSAIMTMVKAIIGGGFLGLPFAFHESGWVLGLIAFPLIALLTGYCMLLLIHVKLYAHMSRATTPSDIAQAAFGIVGKRILDVVLVIDSIGCCLSYFMFITHNMEIITGVRQEIWAAVFFVILLLAAFIRPIKLISYFAYVANVCVGIGVVVLIVAIFVAMEPEGKAVAFNWGEFPIFLGIVFFAFQAIELALPVHNSMKNNNKFPLVMIIVLATCLILYMFFGMMGYLRLGDNALSMITEAINVEKYFGFQIAIAVLFIISLFVNILCWIFPVYEVADRVFHANGYRILSAEEKARVLANENITLEDPVPNPNPVPSAVSSNAGPKSEFTPSSYSAVPSEDATPSDFAPSSDSVVVPSGDAAPPAESETFGSKLAKNLKFWCLTTLGRIVTLLIIVAPSVTPIRHHFSNILGLIGCTTGIFMTFIFPPACRVKVEWKSLATWQKILDLAICILAVPLMIYITVMTLIDLVVSMKEELS